MTTEKYESYYVPAQSKWPIVGAIALFLLAFGGGTLMNELRTGVAGFGKWMVFSGLAVVLYFVWGWFKDQINESLGGLFSRQLGMSYRQGMMWFIGSEVMFFAGFFGALYYTRTIVMPWLGGEGNNAMTHALLWPDFIPNWPMISTPDGSTTEGMNPWGLPLINTILLVSSSFTLTYAHHALIAANRKKLIGGMIVTVALGLAFLLLQATEYHEAYAEMGLTLGSGIYGSTFFMLTGFHGMHVTLGTIMLIVMLIRSAKGHFSADKHFAFEAAAWYWHFVDVVWLGLFVFVYIL